MWETSTTLAVAGRSIMTLTGPRRSYPALLRHLDGSTPRRRLFRRATAAVGQTPLLRLFVDHDAEPPAPAVRELLETVDERVDGSTTSAMAVVHAVSAWPGRSYVVALDEVDRPRFFAKVSDRPDDEDRFRREHEMLEVVGAAPLAQWHAPASHGVAVGEGVTALVTDCLPTGAENLSGAEVLDRVPLRPAAGQPVVERDATEVPWIGPALDRPIGPAFRELLDRAIDEPVATALVHGDIGTRNAFRVGAGRPWLVDWEFASAQGPRAADLVSGELNVTLDGVEMPVPELWHRLCVFASAHNLTRQELALGLLYIAEQGHQRATGLVTSLENATP